jgi:hypothetical protein
MAKMDKDEIQSIVYDVVSDAVRFVQEELSPDRTKAQAYYDKEMVSDLKVEEGRSSVIMSEVSDNVNGMLPSFMRIIFGPSQVVEFAPTNAGSVEQARQQTDYVQYVFAEDNPGYVETESVVKDGLIKRLGIFKWGWDKTETAEYNMEGLTPDQLHALAQSGEVEILSTEESDTGISAKLRYVEKEGRCWVASVPPEEFVYARDTIKLVDSLFVGHMRELSRSQLLDMGISEDDIDQYGGSSALLRNSLERQQRQPTVIDRDTGPSGGKANEKSVFIEAYMPLDINGDGHAELVKIGLLGDGFQIVQEPEPIAKAPFATWTPYRTPHTLEGKSVADLSMDTQRIKTNLVRNSLDSFSLSLFPRTAHQDGMVELSDLNNNEIGANIRTHGPPDQVLKSFTHNFMGKDALTFLEYMDAVNERRTGRSNGAAGLDIDALQSMEKAAAQAAIQSTQEQIESLVRGFTETCLKTVFEGIRDMLVEYQPRNRVVQMRGKWVDVDPRVWTTKLTARTRTALGTQAKQEKMDFLAGAVAKMETIFQQMGLENPLVSLVEYRNALAQIAELSGFPDSQNFWKQVTEEQLQQIAQQKAQQPPPPTPEQVIAQAQMEIEKMRAEKDIAIKQHELELRELEIRLRDDRERDKNAADVVLKKLDIEAHYGVAVQQAQIDADIERERQYNQAFAEGGQNAAG